MSISSWFAIGMASLGTLALIAYVFLILPRQMERRLQESLRAFATAIELRAPQTRGTTAEVIDLSIQVGKRAGLSRADRRRLEVAATLRDIGLCAVPYRVVNKVGLRTPDEQAVFERHPEIGAAMLELVPSLRSIAEVVRNHHSADSFHREPLAAILNVSTEFVRIRKTEGDGAAFRCLGEMLGSRFDPMIVGILGGVSSSRAEESAKLL